MGTCIVIGLSFRFCFQLWESGFHLILSDGVISGVGRKWKRSDFFNSDFWFSLGLTTPTLTLLLVKNSLKDFSRTTFNFQGPPTRNVMLQIVRKCTFPVYLLHQLLYIFEFTCLKLIVNSCTQQQQKNALCISPLNSLSYDIYSVLDNQKPLEKHFPGHYIHSLRKFKDFSRTCIEIEGLLRGKWNSMTFQGLPLKLKDFLRLCKPWALL